MPQDPRTTLVQKMIAEGTSDDDIRATLKVFDAKQAAAPTAAAPAESGLSGMLRMAKDVGIGALKGAGSTVEGLAELAANAGMIPGATPSVFNPDMRHPAFQRADEATTASNTPQRVGKVGEQVAEAVLPVAAGVRAIPSAARAGQAFQTVMSAAKDVPVNVEAPGQVALRIQQLAERGGTMPRMVRQFVGRITDPNQAPLTYEEARDFASNISRLSAVDYNRLTPVIQREVGNLKASLNGVIGDAAGQVGMKPAYEGAMQEYSSAAKLTHYKDALIEAFKKSALPAAAGGAGAGYWIGSKARGLFGE